MRRPRKGIRAWSLVTMRVCEGDALRRVTPDEPQARIWIDGEEYPVKDFKLTVDWPTFSRGELAHMLAWAAGATPESGEVN